MRLLSYKVYICFKLFFMTKYSFAYIFFIFSFLTFNHLEAQNKLNSSELITVSDLLNKKHSLESNNELKNHISFRYFQVLLKKPNRLKVSLNL